MRLAELQRAFQCRVLGQSAEFVAATVATPTFDAETRLGIYEHAFVARLAEALSHTYPALKHYLEDDAFNDLVREYALRNPPTHFSIRQYGENLADNIGLSLKGPRDIGLRELARWEWLLGEVFDAADSNALSRDDLAALPPQTWASVRFELTPSLRRTQLTTNAIQWWRWHADSAPRPSRWRINKPCQWVLWRANLKTYFRSLPNEEAWTLDAMIGGDTFATVCDGLAHSCGVVDAPLRAATYLQRWISDGWIAAAQVDASRKAED